MTIDRLPDELIQQILLFVLPQHTAANVQRASKRLACIGDGPLLWRHHCITHFKYWNPDHRVEEKLSLDVGSVDWKGLFAYRYEVDIQTTKALNSILAGQTGRIQKFENISKFGYDAKDTLLRHSRVAATAEDTLSRRYYSNAVLDHIHRGKALDEWWRLSKGEEVPVERALGSFDMFVLHDEYGDLLEITRLIDEIAIDFRHEHPNLEDFSMREKALQIVKFLRSRNLMGLQTELLYHDLQNNYIGIALRDSDHPSLPLISAAIYSCVAQRLAIDAHCCGFPTHVHAVVRLCLDRQPESGPSLDSSDVELLHVDPFRSDSEIPIEHLRSQLLSFGIPPTAWTPYLRASTTSELVLRTSRNILATIHEFEGVQGDTDNTGHPTIRLYGNPFADLENAFYSALWANFMLYKNSGQEDDNDRLQFVPLILERFARFYPMDAIYLERYVHALTMQQPGAERWGLQETIRVVRAGDAMPKQIRRRKTQTSQEGVMFSVGQVFQHRRYGYIAVIIGWDIECAMNSQWIAQNRVDDLSRGRYQSFYHVLVEDSSIRYVAEENMEIITPGVPTSLMSLAGRYFKRWDPVSHTFVSNIQDEYPDN